MSASLAQHQHMIGKVIGTYQILQELGQGYHGTVYKALDQAREQVVTLKAIRAELLQQTVIKQNLRALATTLMQLQHPHLATFHTQLQVGQDLFLISEYVEGESLAQLLQHSGVLPLEQAVGLGRQALEALSYVHRAGLVHGGLSPHNLLLTADSQLKITDLSLTLAAGPSQVYSGLGPGLLNYVAPEQIHGEPSDARTDLYALGAVLYELITGLPPFRRANDMALLKAHLDETPPSPRNYFPLIPLELEEALLRALAKPRQERFQVAEDFQAALTNWGRVEPSVPAAALPIRRTAEDLAGAPTLVPAAAVASSSPAAAPNPPADSTNAAVPAQESKPSRLPDTLIDLPAQLTPSSWPQLDPQASSPARVYSGVLANTEADSAMHNEVVVELEESATTRRSFGKPLAAVMGIATLLGASYAVVRLNNRPPSASGQPQIILQVSPTPAPSETPTEEPSLAPAIEPAPSPLATESSKAASAPVATSSPVRPSPKAAAKVTRAPISPKPPAKVVPSKPTKGKPATTPASKKNTPAPQPAPDKNGKKKNKKDKGAGDYNKGVGTGGKQKSSSPAAPKEKQKKKP